RSAGSAAITSCRRPRNHRTQGREMAANLGILIWNIEDFGRLTALKRGPDGTRRYATLAAVAQILRLAKADILVIQEFRKNGQSDLARLQYLLSSYCGYGFKYDYIPGAVKAAKENERNITSPDDLAYSGFKGDEGYAVLWKAPDEGKDDLLQPL